MSKLKIGGRVNYVDGSPAKNATVRIIDQDDRSADNVIFTDTTDSQGKFSGTSIDWKDESDGFWPWEHDFLSLKFEVTDSIGRTHSGPFIHISNYVSVPIILPFVKPAIKAENRALIVLSDLSSHVDPPFNLFYQFLESNGVSQTRAILGSSYAEIKVLGNGEATLNNLIANLRRLTSQPKIWEVDLIIFLHGSTEAVVFSNGSERTSTIRARFAEEGISRSKIRMVYSTACFAASHADDFVSSGFNCASGAKGINTNGAVELIPFLNKWKEGKSFGACINEAENLILSAPFDAAARLIYPKHVVNSDKEVFGESGTTINTF